MEKEHLYTVIIEVHDTREVFINQLRTTKTHPSDILLAWVTQAIEQEFIKETEDPQVPLREITMGETFPDSFRGVFNVWRSMFATGRYFIANLSKYVYFTVDFIKTSESASVLLPSYKASPEPSDSHLVRQAEAKYTLYEERYRQLKGAHVLDNAISKERKHAERWMIHWDAKRKFYGQAFNGDDSRDGNSLYTVMMYYRGGTYLKQFSKMPNNDAKLMLLRFVNDLFRDVYESEIITPPDRVLLVGKLSQDVYVPLPVAGSTNVWGTYCSLSEDVANIFVIKTALDEVAQE